MTEILEAWQPKDKRGNDANDHRHNPEFLSELEATMQEEKETLGSWKPIDLPVDLLCTYEWVVDQFIYDGCMNISGSHGAGKTTALVPIAMAVGGVVEHPDMPVTIHRNVLYIAEDPAQVFRTMYGAIEHQNADLSLIRERITVVQAKRKPIEAHTELAELAKTMHRTVTCPAGSIEVKPLVIYDTTSASFQLQNENDNAEVSLTISKLRHMYPGYPLWLTTHQPKSIARGDIENMTSRGAGAWEADVQGVFYLFVDEDEETRVLYGDRPVKRRDTGTVREVSITAQRHTDTRTDRFGIIQTIPYLVVDLHTSTREDRKDKATAAKAEAARKRDDALRGQILNYISKQAKARQIDGNETKKDFYPTKSCVITEVVGIGFPRDLARDAVSELLEEGEIVDRQVERGLVLRKDGKPYLGSFLNLPKAGGGE